MAALELRVLGEVTAFCGGAEVDLGHPRQRVVFAALVVDLGRVVSVDTLLDRVWMDSPPRHARNALSGYVSRLKQVFAGCGDVEVSRAKGGYRLTADPLSVDLYRFRALVGQARAAADVGAALRLFDQALGLWHGTAFSTLDGPWLRDVRAGLDAELLAATLDRNDLVLRTGRHSDVLGELAALAEAHPMNERVAGQYMHALYGSGRQADALRHYELIRSALSAELGTDPSPPLRELHGRILRADPGLDARPAAVPATRGMFSLRADIATFTGRHDELRELVDTFVTRIDKSVHAIAIHAVDGMPGVGKTTFSVHAAHHIASHFPDGVLLVELHGHTPGHAPTPPAEALHSLLLDVGLEPAAIPKSLDDRARAWRRHTADKKILLVLDDAIDHHQVRPLIPGTPGSLVLITSRHRMPALDGVQPFTLDVLPPAQATEMLLRIAGRERHEHDKEAVADIVDRCGYLPLAIAVAAARLRSHPSWTVRYLADLLADARERLDHLHADDRSVTAAIETSFHHLPPERQHVFRLLGLHPGPEVDAYSTAALAGSTLIDARRHLDALHADHLIQETSAGRYQLHDLIRAFATTLEPADRDNALNRVLDYYLHTAATASTRLPQHNTLPTSTALTTPAHTPRLDTPSAARTWLTTELPTLTACITHIPGLRQVPELATTLQAFLRLNGYHDQALAIHDAALAAATYLDDRRGQANALTNLGITQRLLGQYASANDTLNRAHTLYTELEDRLGEANALVGLGQIQQFMDDFGAAYQTLTRAHTLYTELEDLLGQANALNELGRLQDLRGEYELATDTLTRAHNLFLDLGDLLGQANTLEDLGYVQELRGEYAVANHTLTRAHDLFTRLGDRRGQANALLGLGRVRYRQGEYTPAADTLSRAHVLYTELGARLGQANALNDLGRVQYLQGGYSPAMDSLTRAHDLFIELDNRLGQANVLTNLGRMEYLRNTYPAAADSLTRARDVYTELCDPDGQAEVLNYLGDLALEYPAAGDPFEIFGRALGIARDIGAAAHEAHALAGQAQCLIRAGENADAVALLQQAHDIYDALGSLKAHNVKETLMTAEEAGYKS
jgi:DNA-binding SARP family transcriptional activator/tetratricopeptide (TPR) repeat protein